jgi:hypothetical protein
MNWRPSLPFAAALALLGGCALFRWSGYRDPAAAPTGTWSAVELVISTTPAAAPAPELPLPENIPPTLYYADLGLDTIDVSDYPAQQKYNYRFFQVHCARCHTLARAINSPVQSRAYWHYHMIRMSLRSRLKNEGPIPSEHMKAMLDFLEYDSRVRKVENRKRFEAQTEELKRRFEPTLSRLLEHLQKSEQPRLLSPGEKQP